MEEQLFSADEIESKIEKILEKWADTQEVVFLGENGKVEK